MPGLRPRKGKGLFEDCLKVQTVGLFEGFACEVSGIRGLCCVEDCFKSHIGLYMGSCKVLMGL